MNLDPQEGKFIKQSPVCWICCTLVISSENKWNSILARIPSPYSSTLLYLDMLCHSCALQRCEWHSAKLKKKKKECWHLWITVDPRANMTKLLTGNKVALRCCVSWHRWIITKNQRVSVHVCSPEWMAELIELMLHIRQWHMDLYTALQSSLEAPLSGIQ